MRKDKKGKADRKAKDEVEGKKINWSAYNRELINRGSLTVWFNIDEAANWYAPFIKGKEGRPFKYSDVAIQMLCLLGIRFGLTLRSLQGFAESLMDLMGYGYLEVPYYTTFSKRMRNLEVELFEAARKVGNIHLAIDSTGLKIFGEGEWKMRIHGKTKRRTWRKLHLGVDTSDNTILTAVLTTNDFKDGQLFADLVNQVEGVDAVYGDGGYDSKNCFDYGEEEKIKKIIPPRKDAKISKRGSQAPRDKILREIRAKGRKGWKKDSGYHRRSLSETAMARVKGILGEKLRSRIFENQAVEAFTKIKILNLMKTPKALDLS